MVLTLDSKRQFTRKIEEWGFRKNFRRDEREEIVNAGVIPDKFMHDTRINQKRLQRLQRRNGVRICFGLRQHGNESLLDPDQNLFQESSSTNEDTKAHATTFEDRNLTFVREPPIIKETSASKD